MAIGFSTRSLAQASARRPWTVIGLWVVGFVVSMALISNFLSDVLTTQAEFTNQPESKRGLDLLEARLRGPQKANEAIIVVGQTNVSEPAFRSRVESLVEAVRALGPAVVESATTFYETQDATLVSADGTATIIPIVMAGDLDTASDNIAEVIHLVEAAQEEAGGFEVFISGIATVGNDFTEAAESDLQRAEFRALPIALLILVLVFGALVAAIAPMILAFVAIAVAVALVAVVGQVFEFSFFVVNMITMMGLAVGIDYSLFVVSRFREERTRGRAVPGAIAVAGGTAGRAVLFSGLTVIIALLGLLFVPQTIFQSLASGAIFVVLAAVAASLTLLPAILSLLGDKVNRLKVPFVQQAQESYDEQAAGSF